MIGKFPAGGMREGDVYIMNDPCHGGTHLPDVALDEPVRIEVAGEIAGDRVLVDFEDTNPQGRGPFNCVPSGAYVGACFAVLAMTDSTIPINGGGFRPIELRLPDGDRVEVDTARGGGDGGPGARAADRLAADLAGGKVGEAARTRATGAAVGDE